MMLNPYVARFRHGFLVALVGLTVLPTMALTFHYAADAAAADAAIRALEGENARLREETQALRERLGRIDVTLAAIRAQGREVDAMTKAAFASVLARHGVEAPEELTLPAFAGRHGPSGAAASARPGQGDAFAAAIETATMARIQADELAGEWRALAKRVGERQATLAAMPSALPAKGWLSSGFGKRVSPFHGGESMHKGIDLAADVGTPVVATGDGVVRFAGKFGRFGNYVSIVHGQGFVTKYAHNDVLKVKAGDRVTRGQVIATVGQSGRATGSHLHYEVWFKDKPLDPETFIPREALAAAPIPGFSAKDPAQANVPRAMGGDDEADESAEAALAEAPAITVPAIAAPAPTAEAGTRAARLPWAWVVLAILAAAGATVLTHQSRWDAPRS